MSQPREKLQKVHLVPGSESHPKQTVDGMEYKDDAGSLKDGKEPTEPENNPSLVLLENADASEKKNGWHCEQDER